MQKELDGIERASEIRILGVNAAGLESGNELTCQGKDIPWLQDVADTNAWGRWDVTWRDVIVLDEDNVKIATFKLTQHSLTDSTEYDALKTILEEAAGVVVDSTASP